MVLDFQTLVVMTVVNLTIASVAALFVWYGNRPIAGLGRIASGIALICCAFIVSFLLKAQLGRMATWLGNAGMVAGLIFILNGVLRFRGFRSLPAWKALSIALPILAAQTYFLYIQENRTVRGIVLAPCMALLCFAIASVMVHKIRPEERVLHGIVAFALSVYGGMQILRAFALLTGSGMATTLMPFLCLIALNACMIACLFALSSATNARLRAQIENLAFCDPLTGLPNRRKFDEHLLRVRTRSMATGSPVGLIYIDLDRFKEINDRFGHAGGDSALKQAALRLASLVRTGDCLARLGGDEFVIVTERFASGLDARAMVRQIGSALEAPIVIADSIVVLTASCGLAFYPDDVTDTLELVRQADAEMYLRKQKTAVAH